MSNLCKYPRPIFPSKQRKLSVVAMCVFRMLWYSMLRSYAIFLILTVQPVIDFHDSSKLSMFWAIFVCLYLILRSPSLATWQRQVFAFHCDFIEWVSLLHSQISVYPVNILSNLTMKGGFDIFEYHGTVFIITSFLVRRGSIYASSAHLD